VNLSGGSLSHLWRIAIYRGIGSSPCSARRVLLIAAVLVFAFCCSDQTVDKVNAQEPKQESKQAASSKPAETEKNAAQIELLETKYRFETSGDSRKEVRARVRINNELGVLQFARLNFDFNRSFQAVDVPQVRITHGSGGIADILPSAITDNPNPAVLDAPAYQDVRVKSVRILGLQPGDLLEYRVITTTTQHPLAPDFWLDHSFDRTGIVTEEHFELDLPASLQIKPKINPATPPDSSPPTGQNSGPRTVYRWKRKSPVTAMAAGEKSDPTGADISLSTFKSWKHLAEKLSAFLTPTKDELTAMQEKSSDFWHGAVDREVGEAYEFVAQKIRTVDLPLDATGFRTRRPTEILKSRYASAEDKVVLFAAALGSADVGFVSDSAEQPKDDPPSPARFRYLLTRGFAVTTGPWSDLNSEVAPEGMIPAEFRGKRIFVVGSTAQELWQTIPKRLFYRSSQKVNVDASLSADGNLTAKVHYVMLGENELLLRVAFHKTPKEKWKDIAQLLAISDGFRGQIVNITASDPYATKQPFVVDYELSQPKFVDWSKKTVRIPALLPLPGLPEAPSVSGNISGKNSIDLGTPMEIELTATVQLPQGTSGQPPTGTAVERDYATFSSKYSTDGDAIHAARKLRFIASQIPAARAPDLNTFLHAVQADQNQLFTLQRTQPAEK
jgi:Domain of Unknown Function with PDB structure (DUF3857)